MKNFAVFVTYVRELVPFIVYVESFRGLGSFNGYEKVYSFCNGREEICIICNQYDEAGNGRSYETVCTVYSCHIDLTQRIYDMQAEHLK
jgi:hypothetical protein